MRRGAAPILAWLLASAGAFGCSRGGGASSPDAQWLDAGSSDAGPGPCSPACGPAQRCEADVSPPACAEICNAPAGCRPTFETCNLDSGACEPPRCGGRSCQAGQGCFDPASLQPAAGPSAACTCLPADVDAATGEVRQPDSCAALGLVCDYQPSRRAAAACRKPGPLEPCLAQVGCEAGLACAPTAAGGLCLQGCAKGSDCADPTTYCELLDGHCWPNLCARPAQDPSQRARYFQPCDAAGRGDGTCLPFADAGGEVGLCVQAGSAPSHGACDPGADRASLAGLCPVGELCAPVDADPANPARAKGVCAAACDAGPAASGGCSAGLRCVDASPAATGGGPSLQARRGACLPACELLGGDACPAQDALGNALGCFADAAQPLGTCRPILPLAGGLGAPCTAPGAPERRSPCGDRMVCLQGADLSEPGQCAALCDPARCADPGAACADCAGARCQACAPSCAAGSCGDDGCGGRCPCAAGERCEPVHRLCEACTCAGLSCGDDGCGASCGSCPAEQACNPTGQCAPGPCVPQCAGRSCGPDGCGGSCGGCSGAQRCAPGGSCCAPRCLHRTCGDDGCGGSCGPACGLGLGCLPVATGLNLSCQLAPPIFGMAESLCQP